MGQEASKRVWESTYKTLTRRKRRRQPQSSSSWIWECRRPKNCGYDQDQPGQGQRRMVKVTSLNYWLPGSNEREMEMGPATEGSLHGWDTFPSTGTSSAQESPHLPQELSIYMNKYSCTHWPLGSGFQTNVSMPRNPQTSTSGASHVGAQDHTWRNTARWSLPRAGAPGLLCWMSFTR